MTELFVYGTLKRGCRNHRWMQGQTCLGEARTVPGYRLFMLDGYPGMVAWPGDTVGVTGELWRVDPAALARLDDFEGVDEGLYRREPIQLAEPPGHDRVQAYLYLRSLEGRVDLGETWIESAG